MNIDGSAVRCAWRGDCVLGEGPVWDPRIDSLHFVDLKGDAVHSWSPGRGHRSWALGTPVSALALTAAPATIMCFTAQGVKTLSLETGATDIVSPPIPVEPGMRTNDGKCDATGRMWIGTMDDAERRFAGTLYRLGPGHAPEPKLSGIGVSNGLDWSPDGTVFYYTDSLRRTIYRFDFDAATGSMGERTPFAELAEGEGAPDGLCVDAEGHVWSAIWDGGCILRFAPDGTRDRTIPLPVPRPTSVAFGGPDLATLFVTTARIGLSDDVLAMAPLSGSLLALDTDVKGLPANIIAT